MGRGWRGELEREEYTNRLLWGPGGIAGAGGGVGGRGCGLRERGEGKKNKMERRRKHRRKTGSTQLNVK